ncbi:hypothetical protein LOK49_LG03G03329 [Camellia lanceoleosa]|uniref:Uncharacterized protein n=1 Tax=Camellia lanceoleosa TaxID=1840588 RepID=A0ACC0IBY6_9ERIC|nr:hypothetical protein LOK49_LG03G03329 [Camellia lanceoleosa]
MEKRGTESGKRWRWRSRSRGRERRRERETGWSFDRLMEFDLRLDRRDRASTEVFELRLEVFELRPGSCSLLFPFFCCLCLRRAVSE